MWLLFCYRQSWIIAELPKLGPDLSKTSRTEQRAVLVVVKGAASQTHWSGQTLLLEARSAALENESESHSVVSDCLQSHGLYRILQARILERVSFPFSRGSSLPRDQTQVSHTAGRFFTTWAAREAMEFPPDLLPSVLIVYPQIMSLVVLIKIRWTAKTLNPFLLCFLSYGLATIIKAIYTSVSCLWVNLRIICTKYI